MGSTWLVAHTPMPSSASLLTHRLQGWRCGQVLRVQLRIGAGQRCHGIQQHLKLCGSTCRHLW